MVRKRAQVEDDSVGELIKRVEAAQESVSGEGAEKHSNFESWIQKLRDEARDEAAGNEILPEEPVEASAEPEMAESEPEPAPEPEDADHSDWLTRIRKVHGVMDPEEGPNAAAGVCWIGWWRWKITHPRMKRGRWQRRNPGN